MSLFGSKHLDCTLGIVLTNHIKEKNLNVFIFHYLYRKFGLFTLKFVQNSKQMWRLEAFLTSFLLLSQVHFQTVFVRTMKLYMLSIPGD